MSNLYDGYIQTGKTASAISVNRFNLPDSDFADEKDRIFPIFDMEHIMCSLRVFLSDYQQFLKPRYGRERLVHMHDRMINKAKESKVSIKGHKRHCPICLNNEPEKVMFT